MTLTFKYCEYYVPQRHNNHWWMCEYLIPEIQSNGQNLASDRSAPSVYSTSNLQQRIQKYSQEWFQHITMTECIAS